MKTPDPTKAESSAPSKRKFSRMSTATEAQYARINAMFDHPGKQITTLEFRKAGVLHPAGRIREMNLVLGFYIPTVGLRDQYDDQGYLHKHIAVYELVERPTATTGPN